MAIQNDRYDFASYEAKITALDKMGRHKEALECAEAGIKRCHEMTDRPSKDGSSKIAKYMECLYWKKEMALCNLGRYEEAIGYYTAKAKASPYNHTIHLRMGSIFSSLLRFTESRESYEMAIEIKPHNFEAHMGRALALEHMGNYDEAITYYDGAMNVLPEDPKTAYDTKKGQNGYVDVHISKARALVLSGRAKEGLCMLEDLIKRYPDCAGAYMWKGDAMQALGREKEAIACFDTAISVSPNKLAPLYSKAVFLEKLGRPKELLECYEQLVRIDCDAQMLFKKATVHLEAGDKEGCIKCLDESIRMDSNYIEPRIYKERLLNQRRR